MSIRDYIFLQKIGQGSFAVVEKVRKLDDGQQYALKRVRYTQLKQKNRRNALNQIHVLAQIQHPNVIKFKQSFFDQIDGHLCTVMQLAPGGDLAQKIKLKKQLGLTFNEQDIWKIGKDIINGIFGLHEKNIIHRDIKPANVLFGLKGVAKIGDFNVSIQVKDLTTFTQTGTPYYASPQVWNHQPYSFQCDIWSFGCVLYEMCTMNKPFQGHSIERLHRKITKLKYNPITQNYSYKLKNLIYQCLKLNNNRISTYQLKRIFDTHNNYQQFSNMNRVVSNRQLNFQSQTLLSTPIIYNDYNDQNRSSGYKTKIQSHSSVCDIKNYLHNNNNNGVRYSSYYENNPETKNYEKQSTECSIQNKFSSVLDKYLIPERKLPSRSQCYNIQSMRNLRSNRIQTECVSPTRKNEINCGQYKSNRNVPFSSRYYLAHQPSLQNLQRKINQYRINNMCY